MVEQPVAEINILGDEWWAESERPGFRWRRMRLAGDQLGASLYEIPPGEHTWPYHYEIGSEELLVVVAGVPTLRDPDGERELSPGDTVLFPSGPGGAHQITNNTQEPVRVLMVSNFVLPRAAAYPDSGKLMIRWSADADDRLLFRRQDAVDYWEGEESET